MQPRPLTPGEIALAKSVFGDAIDYSKVTVTSGQYVPLQPEGCAMAPNGKLYMYGCYSADYSTEAPERRGVFIHEMTHVWQFQNKILDPVREALALNIRHKFNYLAAYAYTLDPKKDLTDYNMEQQASVVQDYFMLKTEGCFWWQGNCQDRKTENERISFYEDVLKNFHADQKYARRTDFPGKGPKKTKPPKSG